MYLVNNECGMAKVVIPYLADLPELSAYLDTNLNRATKYQLKCFMVTLPACFKDKHIIVLKGNRGKDKFESVENSKCWDFGTSKLCTNIKLKRELVLKYKQVLTITG